MALRETLAGLRIPDWQRLPPTTVQRSKATNHSRRNQLAWASALGWMASETDVLGKDDGGRKWSGRRDLNSRPLAPQASALARLRYAPTDHSPCGERKDITIVPRANSTRKMQRIKNPSAHNFAPAKQGVGGLRPARRPRRTRARPRASRFPAFTSGVVTGVQPFQFHHRGISRCPQSFPILGCLQLTQLLFPKMPSVEPRVKPTLTRMASRMHPQ